MEFKKKIEIKNLEKYLPWSLFRGLSNFKATKLTILIPILGYWILFNQHIIEYLHLSDALSQNTDQQSPPQNLLFLYFGLCFIAFASFIYQLFCPVEIKKYDSTTSYIAEEKNHLSRYEIEKRVNELYSTKKVEEFKERLGAYEYDEDTISPTHKEKLTSEFLCEAMDFHYQSQNLRFFILRVLLICLYFIGFIFISIPSLRVFSQVVFLIIKSLY